MSNLKTQNHSANLKTANVKIRAYKFSLDVINFIQGSSGKGPFRVLFDQLLRCATSVGANIVEARAASSKKDFARFYEIALKSANETKYWLCLLRETSGMDRESAIRLLDEAQELSNMLGASLLTIKGKRKIGQEVL